MRDDSFKEFIEDQLRELADLEFRSMFGGWGLYLGDVFFGIIYRGRLYFRTDADSHAAYVERGMKPFRPNPKAKQTLHSYYEVPAEIVEDRDALPAWARTAVDTRRATTAARVRRRRRPARPGEHAARRRRD